MPIDIASSIASATAALGHRARARESMKLAVYAAMEALSRGGLKAEAPSSSAIKKAVEQGHFWLQGVGMKGVDLSPEQAVALSSSVADAHQVLRDAGFTVYFDEALQRALNKAARVLERAGKAAERERAQLRREQERQQREELSRQKELHRLQRQAEREQDRADAATQREHAARMAAEQKAAEARSKEELARITKTAQAAFTARCHARTAMRLEVLRSAQK